jgi:hypothetical protein
VNAIVDIQSARPSLLLGVRAMASRACIRYSPYGPCGAAPDQGRSNRVSLPLIGSVL